MKNINNYRHGDVGLFQIDKLPKGLKKSASDIILAGGSGGNTHSFKGGNFYPKIEGEFIIGYLKAKKTILYHAEHSPKGVGIDDGVYEVRRQVEYTPEGLRQVID